MSKKCRKNNSSYNPLTSRRTDGGKKDSTTNSSFFIKTSSEEKKSMNIFRPKRNDDVVEKKEKKKEGFPGRRQYLTSALEKKENKQTTVRYIRKWKELLLSTWINVKLCDIIQCHSYTVIYLPTGWITPPEKRHKICVIGG